MSTFEAKVAIKIETLATLFCSAMESGDPVTTAARGGWCAAIEPIDAAAEHSQRFSHWYADAEFWKDFLASNWQIEIFEVRDESKEWNVRRRRNVTGYKIDANKLREGFGIMARVFPHAFGEVINDETDATTADALLQSLCFGSERYA